MVPPPNPPSKKLPNPKRPHFKLHPPLSQSNPEKIRINYWNCRYLNSSSNRLHSLKIAVLCQDLPEVIMINEPKYVPEFNNYITYHRTAITPSNEEKVIFANTSQERCV